MARHDITTSVVKPYEPELIGDDGIVDDDGMGSMTHPLDSEESRKVLSQLEDYRRQAKSALAEGRREMAIDDDIYDSLHWTPEEKYELEVERGQPALTFNKTATVIDWITGTEKRTRVDFGVFPRGKEDTDAAKAKEGLIKYISDVNQSQFHISAAFASAVKVGVGWIEEGVRSDPNREPLFVRSENWRNVWYDHLFTELDGSDMRYLFREKHLDLDICIAMFPERRVQLESAAEHTLRMDGMDDDGLDINPQLYGSAGQGNYRMTDLEDATVNNRRRRVKVVEMYYRVPKRTKILKGKGPFAGSPYNEQSPDPIHQWAVQSQQATLVEAVTMVVHQAIFISGTLLSNGQLPYWHNRFPLTPIWGKRRARDGAPYGAIRNIRDAQFDLNKRRSKALHILSTKQVIADDDATDDWDALAAEVARPDGIIKHKKGSSLTISADTQLAEEHIMLMRDDERMIQDGTGVTDENMGRQTNATSGKAIEARQNQGTTTTADWYDNLRFALQLTGDKQLSLAEQYYDDEKVFRILGETGKPEYQTINQAGPDGSMINSITQSKADFKIDSKAYADTMRQALFEELMALIGKLPPEVGLQLLDVALEISDIPQRDLIIGRVRKINGQVDPDAEEDPEETARRTQQEQEQQIMAKRQAEATVKLLEGKAKEAEAKGDKEALKAIREKIATMKDSQDVVAGLMAHPLMGKATDAVMADASRGIPRPPEEERPSVDPPMIAPPQNY